MTETAAPDVLPAAVVSVRSVNKAFGARPVLRNVTLTIPAGQAVCLCGVNGAGKSTLLRIVSGLLRPDAGTVAVNAFDMHRRPEEARRQLGMISHATMVYPELTVQENLAFAARLYRVDNRLGRIEELLIDADLVPFRHDRASILSRGLLQRLAIARALVHRPAVLLADEPFTGLDADSSNRLLAIFGRFIRDGGTILMTTHDIRLGLQCCGRLAVLDKGVLILDAGKEAIDLGRFANDYLSYARSAP